MTELSWETRQPAEPHEMWQDSAVLAWADLARGVGGYHRIGVQPGHPDGPAAQLSHDFHPAVDIYPKSGQVGQRIASGHLGWGVRFWEEILVHRGAVATFGPDETVYAVSILGSHGKVHDFGALVRGAELVPATEVDVVTFLERDGPTHRGGTVRMVLATGEGIELRAEPLQKGIISFMAGRSAINDTICRFAWGDRIGVGDFEISNSAVAGASEPVFAINGVIVDGLHLLGAQP